MGDSLNRCGDGSDDDAPEDGEEDGDLESESLLGDCWSSTNSLVAVRWVDESLAETSNSILLREDPQRPVVAEMRDDKVRLESTSFTDDAARMLLVLRT